MYIIGAFSRRHRPITCYWSYKLVIHSESTEDISFLRVYLHTYSVTTNRSSMFNGMLGSCLEVDNQYFTRFQSCDRLLPPTRVWVHPARNSWYVAPLVCLCLSVEVCAIVVHNRKTNRNLSTCRTNSLCNRSNQYIAILSAVLINSTQHLRRAARYLQKLIAAHSYAAQTFSPMGLSTWNDLFLKLSLKGWNSSWGTLENTVLLRKFPIYSCLFANCWGKRSTNQAAATSLSCTQYSTWWRYKPMAYQKLFIIVKHSYSPEICPGTSVAYLLPVVCFYWGPAKL